MGPRVVVAADHEELSRVAADELAAAIRRHPRCALCLSGGSTPRRAYELLAEAPGVAWARVDVFFGDERAVAADAPESNYRMVREAFLGRLPAPPIVHRMEADAADLDAAAARYEDVLPEALDVLLLGMGPDGHTASLFPGSLALREMRRRVVAVESPVPPRRRLTITPPVIAAARERIVLVSGEDKADSVALALEDERPTAEEVPARLARDGLWLLDRGAARRLRTCSSG